MDYRALAPLQELDAEGLHRTVHAEGISMCGIAPAVAGVAAARILGARSGRLVAYSNSGEHTGDFVISDAVATFNYLFLGGAPPPLPGPSMCGTDASSDDLTFEAYALCL